VHAGSATLGRAGALPRRHQRVQQFPQATKPRISAYSRLLFVNMSGENVLLAVNIWMSHDGLAMYTVAPKGRTPVRRCSLSLRFEKVLGNILDERPPVLIFRCLTLSCRFAMFSLNRPRCWRLMRDEHEGNWGTIYGIEHVLADTQSEKSRSGIPDCPPVFKARVCPIAARQSVGADGVPRWLLPPGARCTGYFSSKTIHCASCLKSPSQDGRDHVIIRCWGAAIIHPDFRK